MADAFGKIAGSAKEANQRNADNRQQRKEAGLSTNSIILGRNDLDGSYDANRLLRTTLGGVDRDITPSDLVAFKRNVATAQEKFKGGITAQQVINLSINDARDRASKQITMVVPSIGTNKMVRFITNASKESKKTRHFVNVQFTSFNAAMQSNMEPRKAVNWIRKQPLKFECDCENFTFWYRYIASIGDFNAGRKETGFPKIRNPQVRGVACKHALRVMSEIERGGVVQTFLQKLLVKARADDFGNAQVRTSEKEADRAAKGQKRRTTGNILKTSLQKRAERSRKNAAKASKSATKPKINKRNSRKPIFKDMAKIDKTIADLKQGGVPDAVLKQVRDNLIAELNSK
ncbi:MAG: hypothetical protein QM500_16385 [Methylococcales bacterium]